MGQNRGDSGQLRVSLCEEALRGRGEGKAQTTESWEREGVGERGRGMSKGKAEGIQTRVVKTPGQEKQGIEAGYGRKVKNMS